jgi:hypothetical protein
MRGEVEIWEGDKLLHKEPNMLVDGAGELLADIMTASPSLSGVADTATSSILDASNYMIQAISFGTGSDAFRANAHVLDEDKIEYINGLDYATEGAVVPVIWNAVVDGYSYVPTVGVPHYPDPSLSSLDVTTNVSATFTGSGVTSPVSAIFPGNGQHVNFLPSSIASSVMEDTQFSETSSMAIAASVLGAFPEGSSTPIPGVTRIHLFYPTFNTSLTSKKYYGFFNEVSSMDVSGFVNMVMSGSPGTTTGYQMSSVASGLCVSGGHDPTNSGTVEYSVGFASGDVATVNMYGGIYHLGLWTIDMNKSLLNGNSPPFSFSVLNNPRKYKLFARKGLSKNLCFIQDNGVTHGFKNYKDLTIKWRLHFL